MKAGQRPPKRRVTTGPRYTCAKCGVQTVHLMQMVQHGIIVHGLTLGAKQ